MIKKFALLLIVALLVQALHPLQSPQTASAAHSAGVAAPRSASASWTGKEIKVGWDKVSQSKGYRVFRSTKPDRDFQIIHATSGANNNEYRDTSVTMGELSVRYYYTVRSIGNGGRSLRQPPRSASSSRQSRRSRLALSERKSAPLTR